jgi:hypothetical protein
VAESLALEQFDQALALLRARCVQGRIALRVR